MIRAVHIDFRAQKLRYEALFPILRDIAELGYNAILMEYMDSFPYDGALATLASPDALTKEQLAAVLAECDRLGLEVIPLVQCFGHAYWVLRHPEFEHLAEGYYEGMPEDEKVYPWGWMKLTTMCAQNPAVGEFWRETVRQIVAAHPRLKHFHIGGDEIKLPSCPDCLAKVERVGLSNLLADHYIASCDAVSAYGVEPMLWGDVVLAYPDTLERLRDRGILVDWNYSSDGKPTSGWCRLWGGGDPHDPSTWNEAQKKYILPHYYYREPDLINPFPYVNVLRAMGCRTILASAVRCGGDSFCFPREAHVANTEEAVLLSEREGIDGFIITGWACRRAPWQLCTYPIYTAAMRSKNPDISREELDRGFAERYLGTPDPAIGKLYRDFGKMIDRAVTASAIIASYNEHSDAKTGLFFGLPFDVKCYYLPRAEVLEKYPDKARTTYAELKAAIETSREVLQSAAPKTEEQAYTLTLWHWSLDTLEFFCEAVSFITAEGKKTKKELAPLLARMEEVKALCSRVLSKGYTDGSVEGGLVTRFSHLEEYLDNITK